MTTTAVVRANLVFAPASTGGIKHSPQPTTPRALTTYDPSQFSSVTLDIDCSPTKPRPWFVILGRSIAFVNGQGSWGSRVQNERECGGARMPREPLKSRRGSSTLHKSGSRTVGRCLSVEKVGLTRCLSLRQMLFKRGKHLRTMERARIRNVFSHSGVCGFVRRYMAVACSLWPRPDRWEPDCWHKKCEPS
jgi:hypothetical protein